MALSISKNELKERLEIVKEKMEINPEDENILKDVLKNDTYGISVILASEGKVRQNKQTLERIKLDFLKYQIKDYDEYKKYLDKNIKEWDFLKDYQISLIKNVEKNLRISIQEYMENRGDLMIYRKTINSFIYSRLKDKENLEDLKEINEYLLNNYSYQDTLFNLGLNPEIGEDGFIKLNKLKINEGGKLIL